MRAPIALLLLCLAGCSGNPSAYGITGPGAQQARPRLPDDATVGQPGLPDTGTVVGPSITPSTGSSRYWGYN
jgi:hypothetical protein